MARRRRRDVDGVDVGIANEILGTIVYARHIVPARVVLGLARSRRITATSAEPSAFCSAGPLFTSATSPHPIIPQRTVCMGHHDMRDEVTKSDKRIARSRSADLQVGGGCKKLGEPGDLCIELAPELAIARPLVDEADLHVEFRLAHRLAPRCAQPDRQSLPHSIGIA